jgi:UDPglucose 6-dehydrogenase
MNICIVGTGYVGLVTGTCLSELGHNVICIDIDQEKINKLKSGQVPIYEPGLEAMVHKHLESGRLDFSTNLAEGIDNSLFLFIAVGTPPAEDGSADLTYVYQVAKEIGKTITSYKVIITKSTVPVGTAEKVSQIIREELINRGIPDLEYDVVSNPEFLREGNAVSDFLNPERIVVGTNNVRTAKLMQALYDPLVMNGVPMLVMDPRSAEITKYATNSMLATRISFMNEMAALCDAVGADIEMVKQGIGLDSRIGNQFLSPGTGYGGSCFPKDVRALIHTASLHQLKLQILEAVDRVNRLQKTKLVDMVVNHFGSDLSKYRFAVWGLSFKPHTDDIRESPSLDIILELRKRGAAIHAHDPVAIPNARKVLDSDQVYYFDNYYEALEDADALLLVTDWPEYKHADIEKMKMALNQPVIFDGRNLFHPSIMEEKGFTYFSIGRGNKRGYT